MIYKENKKMTTIHKIYLSVKEPNWVSRLQEIKKPKDFPAIGKIAKIVTENCKDLTPGALEETKKDLKEIKNRVDAYRSGNLFIKYFRIFKSSIYNGFQGYGFADSSTLLNRAIKIIEKNQAERFPAKRKRKERTKWIKVPQNFTTTL